MVDDGRRPTILGSLWNKLTQPATTASEPESDNEPLPELLTRGPQVELQLALPKDLDVSSVVSEHFLNSLGLCREPIAFELLGVQDCVSVQFAAHAHDAPLLQRQLAAYFPKAVLLPPKQTLEQAWCTASGEDAVAVEFGLAREFMLPLANGKLDPFIGLISALSGLQAGEVGLFQVLWQPVHHPWADETLSSVLDHEDRPFFVNAPELAAAARKKAQKPLYASVVRVVLRMDGFDRLLQLGRDIAASLAAYAHPQGNELIPLANGEYPFEPHIEDALRRQSRRPGMILNADELAGFVHLPSSDVRSPALQRETAKTKVVARPVEHGILLGTNTHVGKTVEVRLTPEQRVRHCHIIGASGTGKSSLLLNLIQQDIENGQGIAVFDPHGDLIDRILGDIPQDRIEDVILIDPADDYYSVGFNILSAHNELEKNLLASDLVAIFQRLSTSWGDQMNSVLQNAILAFLESSKGGTLADLRKFLIEPSFRADFLKSVGDPEIVYYWQKGFSQLSGNKSIGPIITRLEGFLAPKPIRHMVSQPVNRLDFADLMDSSKIFLARLPQGLLGKENAHLLGSLLMAKFQQMAMSRQAKQVAVRKDFWIYADEFQNYITPSMAEILSGGRKYRVGLTLAHHELQQLQRHPDVASAVMTHPHTRIVFRVGDEDARKLAEGFSFFEAADLRNLETAQAIARIERSDHDFNLAVPWLTETGTMARRQEVIARSQEKYGTRRTNIETAPVPVREAASTVPLIVEASVPTPNKVVEPVRSTSPQEPRDLGKGGEQHKIIQRRIKEAAEALGFRCVIEKQLAGQESVDLLLERGEQRIACEISVTTTIDHEVGNVAKCLKAGLPKVAVICLNEERLRKIATALTGSLGAEAAARVLYYLPDQFIADLKILPAPETPATTSHGYKVKRSTPALTPDEQRQREESAIRLIAEAMRSKPLKNKG